MARLTEEQIKRGLFHADIDVRSMCLHYFADCPTTDASVMPLVIDAIAKFGRDQSFHYSHPMVKLRQTDNTVKWVIEELQEAPFSNYRYSLLRVLMNADVSLLEPQLSSILELDIDDEDKDLIRDRLRMSNLTETECWRQIDEICEKWKDELDAWEFPFDEAERFVSVLSGLPNPGIDRMMEVLANDLDDLVGSPLMWLEPLMAGLAGKLRHEPAIPHLVRKLHHEGEVIAETSRAALTEIGTDAVVEEIKQHFADAEWSFRISAAGILEHIHSDFAVEVGLELLANEPDWEIQEFLASSMVMQFSHEANEAAYKLLLTDFNRPEIHEVFLTACNFMEQDFPELDDWRKKLERAERKKLSDAKRFLRMSRINDAEDEDISVPRHDPGPVLAPIRVEQRVGRNEKCPCGSGKKFKKCCLGK